MADPTPVTHKVCSRCREEKPREEFRRHARTKDRLQGYCKPCSAEVQREYRSKNAEKVREWSRENMRRRREADPEGMAEAIRKWRKDNAATVAASKRRWEAENRERVRAYANPANRRWKSKNPDKVREYDRQWAAKNPEKVAAKGRRWRTGHPEAVRALKQRRRALISGASIGRVDPVKLWRRQCGICPLCLLPIDSSARWPDPMSKSLDHIVPLSKGGTHEESNLQWTHLVCNIRKGAKAP